MTKKGSSFGYKSSHVFRGRVCIGDIFVRGIFFFFFFRNVVRTFLFFYLLFFFCISSFLSL